MGDCHFWRKFCQCFINSSVETVLSGDMLFKYNGPRCRCDFIKRRCFVIDLFFAPSFKRHLFKMAADFAFRRFCFIKPNFTGTSLEDLTI